MRERGTAPAGVSVDGTNHDVNVRGACQHSSPPLGGRERGPQRRPQHQPAPGHSQQEPQSSARPSDRAPPSTPLPWRGLSVSRAEPHAGGRGRGHPARRPARRTAASTRGSASATGHGNRPLATAHLIGRLIESLRLAPAPLPTLPLTLKTNP